MLWRWFTTSPEKHGLLFFPADIELTGPVSIIDDSGRTLRHGSGSGDFCRRINRDHARLRTVSTGCGTSVVAESLTVAKVAVWPL